MKVTVEFVEGMHFLGKDDDGIVTAFDASAEHGGQMKGSPPMVVLLEAVAACTAMDVISILRKKRKTVQNFHVVASAERAREHPRVFERIELLYRLWSPDAEMKDLERAIELSQEKYCAASAIVKRSGAAVQWKAELYREPSLFQGTEPAE